MSVPGAHDDDHVFAEHVAALNLERIMWLMGLTFVAVAAVAVAADLWQLQWPRMLASGLWADGAAAVVTLAAAAWLRRQPPRRAPRAFLGLVVLALLLALMDFYFFALLPIFGRSSTYAIGVICAAVWLVVPPRQLLPLLAANHGVFLALLSRSQLPRPDRFIAAIDASLGVAIAGLAAWLLYAAKKADFLRTRQLARQGSELVAANHALRERQTEMNEIMAIAAHDLRSPLQGVKHLVELTEAQPALAAPQRQAAAHEISRTCGAMLQLIGRLLDAHAAETAPLAGRVVLADITPIVEEARQRAELVGRSRDVRCELHGPASAVAWQDPAALQQVLDNLLANAVKFSPDRGIVRLTLTDAPEARELRVIDQGPGVPSQERPRLFRKFHRAAAPAADSAVGSGLGLFIARTLTENMGGTVDYEPGAAGGASFCVRLRKAGWEAPATR